MFGAQLRAVAALALLYGVGRGIHGDGIQVLTGDDKRLPSRIFAASPDAVAGYPFAAPAARGPWAEVDAYAVATPALDDTWAALVCSGAHACLRLNGSTAARRLAASYSPLGDNGAASISNMTHGAFQFGIPLSSLSNFMDMLNSNMLSMVGMVLSPALAAMETGFSDVWTNITTKQLALAGAVALLVEQTQNKIEYVIQKKQLADNQGLVDAFYTQVTDLQSDAGQLCEHPYAPVTIFEQLTARADMYRQAVRKVCLASATCVEKEGLIYVTSMVLAFRNAMMCTALVVSKASREAIAKQRTSDISKTTAGFQNDMNDVRLKLTGAGEDDKGSMTIASVTATIASESESDRHAALLTAQKNYEWLNMDLVTWSEHDAQHGDETCGIKRRVDAVEDVSQGLRVDEKERVIVLWETKTAPAIEKVHIKHPAQDELARVEAKYNAFPKDERFGFAVLPRISMIKNAYDHNDVGNTVDRLRPVCAGVDVVLVHGKEYKPAQVTAAEVHLTPENQGVIDSAYGDVDVANPAGSTGSIADSAAAAYFNGITNDKRAATDLAGSFAASDLAKTLGTRDPAILTGPLLGFGLLDKSMATQVGIMDGIEDYVIKTNAVEVGKIKGFTNKIDRYFPQEMDGLTTLGDSMTTWHEEEMSKYNEIDGNVDVLGKTVSAGFSAASSTIGDVQASISNDLSGLKSQVSVSAAETRRVVKGVLDRVTERTMGALGQLSGSISAVHAQTMGQIGALGNVIAQRNEQLRGAMRQEFYQNQLQTQALVAGATNLVVAAARATTSALLDEIDAVEGALATQLRAIAANVNVLQGQIVLLETQFASAQKQLDKMLAFLASIQHTSNEILSAVGSYPEALRKALFASNLDRLLLSYKKLNYVFTKYVESGLAPVYRNDLLAACTTYANMDDLFRSFTNLIAVTTSADRLAQQVAQFDYSAKSYEQFGNQLLVAAYNTQRLSLVCARLQKSLDDDAFLRLAASWDVVVDGVVGLHVVNVEENVPRFFLKEHYTAARLTDALTQERALWNSDGAFALAAIEPLRFRLQQQVDAFTAVTVINTPDAVQLQLWTLEPRGGAMLGLNRYGASRVRDDLVVLWSNTRKELPPALRERLQATELPADAPLTEASLSVAFTGTPWQPYWDAGLVRAVARVAAVDDACPWAVSGSHYPFCWQRARACHCVQLEGVPAAPNAEHMANASLVPTDVALFTAFELVSDPRSEFITTARRQSRASASDAALAPNEMRGIPENRVRFSLCMSSEPPVHAARLATGEAHQPPPQLTRCVASDARVYDVVPDAALNGSSTFLPAGSAVSEAMFRALAIGDTVPEVTFFDAQRGTGNYIVCANCVMDELRTVYMFRVLSFKLGRPAREKRVVCERHPRLPNVEYCPGTGTGLATSRFWTPPVLLATELPRLVASVGASLPRGQSDRVAMAEALSAGLHTLLGAATDDFAFFKVYVARAGAFANATDTYWTSMPTHADREERGWSVVPGFYATETAEEDDGDDEAPPPPTTQAYDALVMWSTLAADARRVAHHVVRSKPAGASLQSHLAATFAAYKVERILRGFFAERMRADATECPVAGDADHFAYCTPTPVDAQCMCVQLEDLPDEYRELYDGRAPHGRVVAFGDDTAVTSYVVGRSRGDTTPNALPVLVDGRMWRNVSDAALCLQTDFSHPERGATCVVAPGGSAALEPRGLRVQLARDAAPPSVVVGERVAEVFVATETWSARCRGCMDAVVSELVQFQEDAQDVDVRFAGLVVGRACATASADGGGELTVCVA